MIFTLNGGPGDGQRVEVGGTHSDGRTVRFIYVHENTMSLYICPSDDDFTKRQLFLSLVELDDQEKAFKSALDQIERIFSENKTEEWKKAVAKRGGKSLVPKNAKLASEKKYSWANEWHNKGHEA